MTLLDWFIVASLVIVLFIAALQTRKYTRSVSAFLAAERCGGRYLISMANAMAGLGVISLVYWFEVYYEMGFTNLWWGSLTEPALVVIALSGWVVYRFRQTRALTLPQFFEMRYSRNFRVFAGLVAYLSGIVNFGIFPAVGARFFMAYCGMPDEFLFLGFEMETFPLLMAGLLSISLVFTFLGGHVAVMVTDFIQGAFANIVFAVVVVFFLVILGWDRMGDVFLEAPAGKSLVNPFDVKDQPDFDIWYYVISVVVVFYGVMTWQGTQGYNCCAKDAHEAKMAGILNGWRMRVLLVIALITPLAVKTFLDHPDFAEQAAPVHHALASIEGATADETATLQNQLRTPLTLAHMLPMGIMGLFCAALLAAFISTHDTYLHSWGSIFIQDVVLPFREKPLSPRQHMWLLRISIFGVALFIFFFSLLVRQHQFIAMYCAITAAIFVGGAGSVIIGGLYWKKGTTGGAWAAMITGMILSLVGILVKQPSVEEINAAFDTTYAGLPDLVRQSVLYLRVELTGQELTFFAIVASVSMYVLVSLLRPGKDHDMDRLLHRGKYAVDRERFAVIEGPGSWLERLGIDREFTGNDRVITYFSVGWPLAWTAILIGGYIVHEAVAPSDTGWFGFWKGYTLVVIMASLAVTVWFTLGGVEDLKYLFRKLREGKGDANDDGRVIREED